MAKAKSTHATWYCKECNTGNYWTRYNKKNPNVIKEKSKFCSNCRKQLVHVRKDTKS